MANQLTNLFGALGLDTTLQAIRDRLPATLGKKAAAASLSVTISSDDEPLAVDTGLTQGLTDAELRLTPVPVSLADVPLATDAATETTLEAINQKLAAPLDVDTGLSQPLTDTQLRQTPVPIGGTVGLDAATLLALENVNANTGLVQGLTDDQLRNSPVPVSMADIPLATGAASDAKLDEVIAAVEGISGGGGAGGATELTQMDIRELLQTLIIVTATMKALMPRLDVAGRAVVAGNEVTQTIAGSVTATVANATVANITSISGYSYANQMFYPPSHIYNAIQVTP